MGEPSKGEVGTLTARKSGRFRWMTCLNWLSGNRKIRMSRMGTGTRILEHSTLWEGAVSKHVSDGGTIRQRRADVTRSVVPLRRASQNEKVISSVLRGFFDVIDDQNVHWPLLPLQFQTKLLLHGSKYVGRRIDGLWTTISRSLG